MDWSKFILTEAVKNHKAYCMTNGIEDKQDNIRRIAIDLDEAKRHDINSAFDGWNNVSVDVDGFGGKYIAKIVFNLKEG